MKKTTSLASLLLLGTAGLVPGCGRETAEPQSEAKMTIDGGPEERATEPEPILVGTIDPPKPTVAFRLQRAHPSVFAAPMEVSDIDRVGETLIFRQVHDESVRITKVVLVFETGVEDEKTKELGGDYDLNEERSMSVKGREKLRSIKVNAYTRRTMGSLGQGRGRVEVYVVENLVK